MKKRIFSLILAVLIVLLSFPITAFAANDSFADMLRKQGFPESYIPALTALHNKYPNWEFEALITNETLSYAVSQERKTHSQQLIEKYSVNDGKGFYCTCPDCYDKNTNKKNIDGYIVKEAPNWVSASQSAVEYYMDPRNFLDEKYIFQFEKLDYNSNQTQDGIETILAGTWMYKSNITYKDKNGKEISYSPATKYSEAIMEAAKASGLSAYYLASKIVQEVGGSKPTADGANGAIDGYKGIYNYYNIGAYTGGKDGLYWASLDGKGAKYFTNTDSVKLRKGPSTSTEILATLPRATAVTKLGETTKQSDGYVWYNVSLTLNGKSYIGYIRSDLIGDNYNRPWTDPYKSIINGAQYIADSFGKTQNTGYLQKFNVNPASSDRHSHEYMANVSAATTEAYKTYTAFKGTNALSGKTTFIIPVYKDMQLAAPTLKVSVNANGTFTLSWNKVSGASKYDLYIKQSDGSYKVMKTTTATSFTTAVAAYGKQYAYKMKAVGSSASDFSNTVNATNNKKLQTPTMKAAVNANGTFKLSWNAVSGATAYELYIKQADGSYKLMKTTTATSFTTAFATYGKQFSYKMRAVKGNTKSAYSSVVNAKNTKKLQTPTLKVTVNSNGTFKLSWNKVTGAEKYELYIKQANGSYKLMKTTTSTSFTTAFATYGKQFSYKMRAVTSKNKSAASAYSSVVNAKNTKKLQTPTLKVTVNSNGTFKLSWNKVTGAEKYELYIKQANGSYKLMKTTTATSFTTAFATYGKQYSYKMRAVTSKNKSAASAYSSVVNAKNTKKLQTPALKVAVNKNGSFKLSWGKVTGAEKYELYIKQANGSYKLMKTTTATSFTTAVAAKGKTYSYKIRAVTSKNKNATSNYSKVVSAKRK